MLKGAAEFVGFGHEQMLSHRKERSCMVSPPGLAARSARSSGQSGLRLLAGFVDRPPDPHRLDRDVDVAHTKVLEGIDDGVLHGGVEPIVPASPMPFTPSGFRSVGVSMAMRSKLGNSMPPGWRSP